MNRSVNNGNNFEMDTVAIMVSEGITSSSVGILMDFVK